MKFKFLGTSAAECIPTFSCSCEMCTRARKLKGPYIRTRSQALINDDLMIDFNPDTHMHLLQYDINMSDIEAVLITHPHNDHFAPKEFNLLRPRFAKNEREKDITVYGSEYVKEQVEAVARPANVMNIIDRLKTKAVYPKDKFTACGKYEITVYRSQHDESCDCYFYSIKEGNKTVLYAHDSGWFSDETWKQFEDDKTYFDMVSIDCTRGFLDQENTGGHMTAYKDIKIREEMLKRKIADENTIFVFNHIAHNGGFTDYAEMCEKAEGTGFIVSYDGMEIEL